MKKIMIIIGLLITILIVVFIVIKNLQEIVTISGEYQYTKGGMGVVDGVLLEDIRLTDRQNYNGKIVEVSGVMTEYPCPTSSGVVAQCFNGPMMINIQSIKVIGESSN